MLTVIKALADPTRLRLLSILEHGVFTVQELVAILQMGQSRISRHLKILVESGICAVEKQGTWSYFRIDSGDDFFLAIRSELAARFNDLDGVVDDRVGMTRVLDERRKKSQYFFDRHARQWDRLASELIPVERYVSEILGYLDAGHTVLDVGVGTGRLLKVLSTSCKQVVGVDHSTAMLDEARRRVADEQMDNVELRLGELTHLPVADGLANCAVLNMVLHHAAAPQKALAEVNRVLEPDGRLVIADLLRHDKEWFHEQMSDQWMGFEPPELEGWLVQAGYRVGDFRKIQLDKELPSVFILTAEKIA